MKNIHLIPTDKPSRLWRNNLLQGKLELSKEALPFNTAQNLYITSNEEIKNGDWHLVWLRGRWEIVNYMPSIGYRKECLGKEVCKIILTTDQDLIKDGVQAVDDEFLKWFVKNPNCKEVYFECYNNQCTGECGICDNTCGKRYKIIILKEEPKQDLPRLGTKEFNDLASVYFGGKPKQETLEEVTEKEFPLIDTKWCRTGASEEVNLQLLGHRRSFTKGAKWQQEQERNNENSWFNQYQEVEDYIIKRIGDKFLEANPEKYNTASEATIALLENNWQQERMYSEEEVPTNLESVLAKITHQNDLGLSQWHEVVYYDNDINKWCCYSGSKTFQDGERVVAWKYCKDLI